MNKVELKGNVGRDPRIVTLENGSAVARFPLATHQTYKDRKGEWREETAWHNIVAWSVKGMPDFTRIRKGAFIELTGKIQYVKYRNPAGEERFMTEIVALKMIIPPAE